MQWNPASSSLQVSDDEVDSCVRESLPEDGLHLGRYIFQFLNAMLKLQLGPDRSGLHQ